MSNPFDEYYDAEVESNAKDFCKLELDEMWSEFASTSEDTETLITCALTGVWAMGRAMYLRDIDESLPVYQSIIKLVDKLEDVHGLLLDLPADIGEALENV